MKKQKIILTLLVALFVFSLFPAVSASPLYENTFDNAGFTAYGKDGTKGTFQSLAELESNVVTSVSASSGDRIAKFDFFPLDLTSDYLPVLYLSNSDCIRVNRDGISYITNGGSFFGAENWIFKWYEITVVYSNSKVQIFADDRCILNCATTTSANGTASVRPAPSGRGDALIDNLVFSENNETKIVFTQWHKYGVPVYSSANGAVDIGIAVYNAPLGTDLMLTVDVKDAKGKLIDAKTAKSGYLANGSTSYIECGFDYPLAGVDEISAYVWDSALKPAMSVKKLDSK